MSFWNVLIFFRVLKLETGKRVRCSKRLLVRNKAAAWASYPHMRCLMEASAEACWRLSKACGQWAAESRDSAARIAFRQMATEWARLAFNEEFISPIGERIDPPRPETPEATPVAILASSLLTPSSENAQPEV